MVSGLRKRAARMSGFGPQTDMSIAPLHVCFQNESPGADKEANWLPAPKGDFLPMLRMYWPKETSPSILNGTWKVPKVERTSEATTGAR
jgi:hypothetical protein